MSKSAKRQSKKKPDSVPDAKPHEIPPQRGYGLFLIAVVLWGAWIVALLILAVSR